MSAVQPYRIVEALCASGKGSEALKEDRLVTTADFVAVIDGATSSGPIDGRPGGIVAAETVETVVRTLPADTTAGDFARRASEALAVRIGAWPDDSRMRPSAAVVVWSVARQEVWRIGDCHFRLDDRVFAGEKDVDKVSYAFRCAVVKARLRLGLSSVEAERRIKTLEQPFMPLVSLQHAFLNVDSADPLAYGALCGKPVPSRFVEVQSTVGVRTVVLCSDGFLDPAATLDQGLEAIDTVRRDDPLMIERVTGSRPFPPDARFFDDTTYIRLALA